MATTVKKIVIVLPNLGLGGAQRQALLLKDFFQKRGASVIVVLTDVNRKSGAMHYALPSREFHLARRLALWQGVLLGFVGLIGRLLTINKTAYGRTPPKIARRAIFALFFSRVFGSPPASEYVKDFPGAGVAALGLRRLVCKEQPDVLISFLTTTNLTSLVATTGLGGRRPFVAVAERNDVCRQPQLSAIVGHRELIYPAADLLLANSMHSVKDLRDMFPTRNARWLPNIGLERSSFSQTSGNGRTRTVCYAGRFHEAKRLDWVINSFCDSNLALDGWQLLLVGGGPERPALTKLIAARGADSSVRILEPVETWWRTVPTPEIVVLSSDYEGAPNFLSEAVGVGALPIVRGTIAEALYMFGEPLWSEISFSTRSELTTRLREMGSDETKRVRAARAVFQALGRHQKLRSTEIERTINHLESHVVEK